MRMTASADGRYRHDIRDRGASFRASMKRRSIGPGSPGSPRTTSMKHLPQMPRWPQYRLSRMPFCSRASARVRPSGTVIVRPSGRTLTRALTGVSGRPHCGLGGAAAHPLPKGESGKAGQDEAEPDRRRSGTGRDHGDEDPEVDQDEERREPRIAPGPERPRPVRRFAPQDEEGEAGRGEEEDEGEGHELDQGAVGPGETEQGGPDPLGGDGERRDAGAGMDPGQRAEEQPVPGHGEGHPGTEEDVRAQAAEDGQGDESGEEDGGRGPEKGLRPIGFRSG